MKYVTQKWILSVTTGNTTGIREEGRKRGLGEATGNYNVCHVTDSIIFTMAASQKLRDIKRKLAAKSWRHDFQINKQIVIDKTLKKYVTDIEGEADGETSWMASPGK